MSGESTEPPAMDELDRLIFAGREGLTIEFKSGMSWTEASTKAKVVKAALAMANNRDGGVIVFGVEPAEDQPTHLIVGMTEEHWRSFSQDDVTPKVNAHANPHIDLTVEHRTIAGKRLVAIVVRPFADYPVICSTDLVENGRPVVVGGKIYCRSRRMPESSEVRSLDDLRDIVDLATAKGLERYFRLRTIETSSTGPNARAQFDAEIADLEL